SVRSGLIMIAITATNAALAIVIGLTLSNALRPGDHLSSAVSKAETAASGPEGQQKIDFWREVAGYVPTSVVQPFVKNSIISIIILALMAGAAARYVKNEQDARGETTYRGLEDLVATVFRGIEVMLGWVVELVPLAVFGVVAKTIGRDGFAPLAGLAAYVGV